MSLPNKNIILHAEMGCFASDVARCIAADYGFFLVDFAQEFQIITGWTETEAIKRLNYEGYKKLRREVIQELKENLSAPAVIVLIANTISAHELETLGLVHQMTTPTIDVLEKAEVVMDRAIEHYSPSPEEDILAA